MKHLVKIFESYYDDMSELDKVIDRFCDESGLDYVKNINHLTHKLDIDVYDEGFCSYAFDNQNHMLIRCFSHNKIDDDKIEWFIKVLDRIDFLSDGKNVYTLGESDFKNSQTGQQSREFRSNKHNVMIRTTVVTTEIWKDLLRTYNMEQTSERDKTLLLEEMSKLDPNDFIQDMFEYYCNNYRFIEDFSIMKGLKDKYPMVDAPIRLSQIRIGYRMARQYTYDMAPLFLKELYREAGMLCKFATPDTDSWEKEPIREDDLTPLEEIQYILSANPIKYRIDDIIIMNDKYW